MNGLSSLIIGNIMGAVGGALLGLALKDWKAVGLLALADAIGFNLVMHGYQGIRGLVAYMPYIFEHVVQMAIWSVVGGAFLGEVLGYREKRKADRVSRSG